MFSDVVGGVIIMRGVAVGRNHSRFTNRFVRFVHEI